MLTLILVMFQVSIKMGGYSSAQKLELEDFVSNGGKNSAKTQNTKPMEEITPAVTQKPSQISLASSCQVSTNKQLKKELSQILGIQDFLALESFEEAESCIQKE